MCPCVVRCTEFSTGRPAAKSGQYQTAPRELDALGCLEKSKLEIGLPLIIERLVQITLGKGAVC